MDKNGAIRSRGENPVSCKLANIMMDFTMSMRHPEKYISKLNR